MGNGGASRPEGVMGFADENPGAELATERRSDEELRERAIEDYIDGPWTIMEKSIAAGHFGAGYDAGVADTVPDRPSANDIFEALADRLGDHPAAHNHYDYSDEPTTRITLQEYDVEVLAEYLAPAVLALLMGGEKTDGD